MDEPADVAHELRGIVEQRYDLIERRWPLLAVIERCGGAGHVVRRPR